jgi:hypothetical protein
MGEPPEQHRSFKPGIAHPKPTNQNRRQTVTIKNRANSSNRDAQEHNVERRSRRLVFSVLTAGLMLGILIAPFLSVESGLAAGAVADEPCSTCPIEANSASVAAYAARYSNLAAHYAARNNASVAAYAARYSDLGAYYAARNDASIAAYAARYSGLARALSAETSSALDVDWYSVDDPSKLPVNIARGQSAETSSALDIDWYSVDDPSKIPANIARGENPETNPALGIDWYNVDDPSKLPM